jgi:anaerobic magnesium-protoporphyrin IX monomethyl ester cyclase
LLKRGKIVLFYPPYDGPALSAPLCLLALAAPLRGAGFAVTVIDAAICPDYRAEVLRECRDAICVGISVLTGPMIRSAVELAIQIRKSLPNLPIVFGGWHPTLLPEQTLRAECVDVVVRGPGELTLLELAERLA